MKEHFLTNILNHLSEEGVPDDLDLRAAIHCSLETKTQQRKGFFFMKTYIAHPRRSVAISVFTICLLSMTLLFTPQGRTWADSALRFFTPAQDDSFSFAPVPTESIILTPTQTQKTLYSGFGGKFATVAEAEAATKIDIFEFPFPLPGLILEYVIVNSDSVFTAYKVIDGGGYFYLDQRIVKFSDSNWQSVPQDGVEIVRIGDIDGEYIEGTFASTGGEMANWTPDAAVTRLRWQDGDWWLELSKQGNVVPIEYMDRDNMIALATSLSDPATRINLQNGYFEFLNVVDARSVTGINISQPSNLPDKAILNKVKVSMPGQIVELEYKLLGVRSLRILQAPINSIKQLVGDEYLTSAATVQIGPYLGWYVETIEGDSKTIKTIWWFESQHAYAIFFTVRPNAPVQLEKTDIIAIAESIH